MSKYSAEEVRKTVQLFAGYSATHHDIGGKLMDIALAFAERIEADERVVAVLAAIQRDIDALGVAETRSAELSALLAMRPVVPAPAPPAQAAQMDAGTEAGWHALRNERDELRRQLVTTEEMRDKFMWQVRDTCRRAEKAESRLAAANALLLRYCVQIGELTKGLDPHDPIYIDIQRLGADYMTHLQGSGDEA